MPMSLSARRISGSVRTLLLPACCANRPHSSLKNDHTIGISPVVGGIPSGWVHKQRCGFFFHSWSGKALYRSTTDGVATTRSQVYLVVPGGVDMKPLPCVHTLHSDCLKPSPPIVQLVQSIPASCLYPCPNTIFREDDVMLSFVSGKFTPWPAVNQTPGVLRKPNQANRWTYVPGNKQVLLRWITTQILNNKFTTARLFIFPFRKSQLKTQLTGLSFSWIWHKLNIYIRLQEQDNEKDNNISTAVSNLQLV